MATQASETCAVGGWEKWHDWQSGPLRPVTNWYCAAIEASPGMRVLDAACGTGLPSLAIATRVGPSGRVVATDVSPKMVAAAGRKAAAAGLDNLEHHVMSLDALAFPDASFDAATCKDGLIFCADPVRGTAELRRVLKPGGRLAVSAWDEPARNPFFTTIFGALARFSAAPPDPRAPGPFRLSPPGELADTLSRAGLGEIAVERRELVFEFDSPEMHWQVMLEMSTPVENLVNALGETERVALRRAVADAILPYTDHGRVCLPAAVLCASARRPDTH